MGKLTGWHTLNLDDVLPTVSTALRLYERNRPALKMRSRRHNLPDRVTEWRIRCDGKPIGSVTLRKPTNGVVFGYAIAPGAKSELLPLAKHGMQQIHSHIKYRIDWEHQVGDHWDIRGIPSSIKIRKKWYAVYDAVRGYRSEQRLEGYEPTLADIEDYINPGDSLRMDDDVPVLKRSTIKKIMAAGDAGKLDHMKSY